MNFSQMIQNHLGAYAAASQNAGTPGSQALPPTSTFLFKMQEALQQEMRRHGIITRSENVEGASLSRSSSSASLARSLSNASSVYSSPATPTTPLAQMVIASASPPNMFREGEDSGESESESSSVSPQKKPRQHCPARKGPKRKRKMKSAKKKSQEET